MFNSLPITAKAYGAYFFSNVIVSGLSYIVTPIYTRLLTAEVYGRVSVFYTWMQIFGIVGMFCLSYGIFNNGMFDYPKKRDEYSFSMLVLSNVITTIFSAILLCFYPLFRDRIKLEFMLLVLMCVIFIFQPAYLFWLARQKYEFKYKGVVIWTVVCAFVPSLTAITAVLAKKNNQLYSRILGSELVLMTIYIGFYLYLAVRSRWKINTKYWKEAFLFNLPLIPHYLSTYLLANSNKILISNIVGDSEVAYYNVAQSVATVITIVWCAFNSSLVPYTYEKCKNKEYSKISKIVEPVLTIFAIVCVLYTLFAPEVVAVMATKGYMAAIYVIPPIVAGMFFQVHYFIYGNIVYYYKKPVYVMVASVTSVLCNFIIGYFLISKFGYLAAGYSVLICYLMQATLDYLAMKKVEKQKIYNMRYIGALSLIVIIVSLIGNFLYRSTIIRYIVIAFLLIVCVVFKNKIIRKCKKV